MVDITNTLWLLGQLGDGRLLFPEQSAKRGKEVADGSRLIAGTYKFFPRAAGEILQRVKTLCLVHDCESSDSLSISLWNAGFH